MTTNQPDVELDEILWQLAADAVLANKLRSGDVGIDKAKAALLAWRDGHTKEAELKARIDALERIKMRLPSPNNQVEEWRGHNLGLSQAIAVVDLELAELSAPQQSTERSSDEP